MHIHWQVGVPLFIAVALLGDHLAQAAPTTRNVVFASHGYELHGCLTIPEGTGPFPVMIYNHGSEKAPAPCGPPDLTAAYVAHGYLFFAFQRHGHGQSPGDYIVDLQKEIFAGKGTRVDKEKQIVALQEDANLDVVGAVAWIVTQPEVDRRRIAMTGISFGGIQTLLSAEKTIGVRAFVAFAPGAESWNGDATLQGRLTTATKNAKAPLFLAQAQNDYSLGPSNVLGPIIRAKGSPNNAKLYPAFGRTNADGHGKFATTAGGIAIWNRDVFAFLDQTVK